MISETLIVCILIYALFSPIAYAKADEIRENTRKLEIENDNADFGDHDHTG
jgi:hypothetical protein